MTSTSQKDKHEGPQLMINLILDLTIEYILGIIPLCNQSYNMERLSDLTWPYGLYILRFFLHMSKAVHCIKA